MRNLWILTLIIILSSSCGRKVKCYNITITARITGIDTGTNALPYILKTYKKGTNYTVLIDSLADTAREDVWDFSKQYPQTDYSKTRERYLFDSVDYYFEIPSKALVYKISDIYYTEKTGVKNKPFNMSGSGSSVVKCYNYIHYTVNGTEHFDGGIVGDYNTAYDITLYVTK
jgi:hypothetical protein